VQRSSIPRSASLCTILAVFAAAELGSCGVAIAQQRLPTIEVGGPRRPAVRGPARPTTGAAAAPYAAASPSNATQAPGPPSWASRFPSEPKSPEQGYVVTNVTTATKMSVPIRQLPVSVQVVPRQVMVDQNNTTLQEALENVPGVRANANELESYAYIIRGFQSLFIYRNNLAIPGGGANPGGFDTANIERVEVLKGPASILYGRADPGGIINIITKQPLDTNRYVVEQQFGSFNHYRTQWDVSQLVESTPGLAYRFSGAYETDGSFRPFQGGRRVLLAPVVSYRPSAWTEFTVDTQFLAQRQQSEGGMPVVVAGPAAAPLSRSYQEPNDPKDKADNYNIGYTFRQNLDEDWKVTNRFLYSATPSLLKSNIIGFCVDPTFCVDSDGQSLQRSTQFQSLAGRTFSTNLDLEGKFTALGGKHVALMGLDYYNSYYDYYIGYGANTYPISMYNPVYGTVPIPAYWDATIGTAGKFPSSFLARQKGFYIQDLITWFDRLHVLLGARYDVADTTFGVASQDYSCPEDPEAGPCTPLYNATKELAIANRLKAPTSVDTAWSPRAGAIFDVIPELSAYGSYSQSFGVNNGFTTNNQPLPPEIGKQWEVGLKSDPLPGLSATLALFQITKSGILTRDFSSPDPFAVKPAGLQRSRGVEFDVTGRIGERWTVIANYALIDAKVINDTPKNFLNPYGSIDEPSGLFSNHLINVPRNSGKIFLAYNFGENDLGLRVGGGVTASTRAWGDLQNTFLLPGWARLDGFASFTTLVEGHKVTAQLNLKNINNAQYFSGTDNYYNATARFNLFPAQPFTAVGSLRFQW
jgi:iron complex outermembrane receptor protein